MKHIKRTWVFGVDGHRGHALAYCGHIDYTAYTFISNTVDFEREAKVNICPACIVTLIGVLLDGEGVGEAREVIEHASRAEGQQQWPGH